MEKLRSEIIGQNKFTSGVQELLGKASGRAAQENSAKIELKHLVPELVEIGWHPKNRNYLRGKGIDLDYLESKKVRTSSKKPAERKYSADVQQILDRSEKIAIKTSRYDISTQEIYSALLEYAAEKPVAKPQRHR